MSTALLVGRRVLGEDTGEPEVAGQVSVGRSDASLLRHGGVGIDDGLGRMLARDKGRYLACESALLRYDFLDNGHGLAPAFLRAGARAVIGAVWPVTPRRRRPSSPTCTRSSRWASPGWPRSGWRSTDQGPAPELPGLGRVHLLRLLSVLSLSPA